MKIILSSRRYHYIARVSIFLITLALMASMINCGGGGGGGGGGNWDLIWTPTQLFYWTDVYGSLDQAFEITWEDTSVSSVQGIIDGGSFCLIWTPTQLFYWTNVYGFLDQAFEITWEDTSVSSVQGIIGGVGFSAIGAEGLFYLIWTPTQLFYWTDVYGSLNQTFEITWEDTSVSSVQDIIDGGIFCLIWTPTQLFYWTDVYGFLDQAFEITWEDTSVSSVQGIIGEVGFSAVVIAFLISR